MIQFIINILEWLADWYKATFIQSYRPKPPLEISYEQMDWFRNRINSPEFKIRMALFDAIEELRKTHIGH